MSERIFEEKDVVESNEKWFSFYTMIPKNAAIVIAVGCFITGIGFAAAEMPVFILVFWFGGAALAGLTYVIAKIATAGKILQITYLKKIADCSGGRSFAHGAKAEESLPEI